MDNNEREVINSFIEVMTQTNNRIKCFTQYVLILLVAIVISMSLLVGYVTHQNRKMVEECVRLYFVTDYYIPNAEVTQTQTIGDINGEETTKD